MKLPGWMRSRWVVVPGLMAIGIGAWNGFVVMHAHGRVDGLVVGADGRPVSGATVVLLDRDFIKHTERARTTSGRDGAFHFGANLNHSLQLEASAEGYGKAARQDVRLWFRSQDVDGIVLRLDAGR